jgi:FkbM family methyltransferase
MDMKYKSQCGQDEWICNFFNFKKNGFFLDIGAYDGVDLSNTYLLENELEWNGICCEANESVFDRLIKNRKCECLNVAVSDFDGYSGFVNNEMYGYLNPESSNMVRVKTIDMILEELKSPKIIDYLSLDIEGSEVNVLSKFPFDEYEVILITVEHNKYSQGDTNKNKIKEILYNNNFEIFKEDVYRSDDELFRPLEDWYINKKHI